MNSKLTLIDKIRDQLNKPLTQNWSKGRRGSTSMQPHRIQTTNALIERFGDQLGLDIKAELWIPKLEANKWHEPRCVFHLANSTGAKDTTLREEIAEMIRTFLHSQSPPKSIEMNDKTGSTVCRFRTENCATEEELISGIVQFFEYLDRTLATWTDSIPNLEIGSLQSRQLPRSLPMSETIDSDLAEIGSREDTSDTEREQLCKCRIGQGKFRQGVIDLWKVDAIEKVERTELLRASHIKPWSDCKSDEERLDPHNGLLLLPNHDHLFDRGWITFDSTGRIQLSKQFTDRDYEALGITEDIKIKIQSERMQQYLDFHSKHLFKP